MLFMFLFYGLWFFLYQSETQYWFDSLKSDIPQPAGHLRTYFVYCDEIHINYCELIGTLNFSTVEGVNVVASK